MKLTVELQRSTNLGDAKSVEQMRKFTVLSTKLLFWTHKFVNLALKSASPAMNPTARHCWVHSYDCVTILKQNVIH